MTVSQPGNKTLSQWTLRWRHNGRDSVSNHQPHDCLLNRLFRRRSKKTSKLRVTGLCAGNSPGTGEFPAQMASNAENVSIWWRHHGRWIIFSQWMPNFQSLWCQSRSYTAFERDTHTMPTDMLVHQQAQNQSCFFKIYLDICDSKYFAGHIRQYSKWLTR